MWRYTPVSENSGLPPPAGSCALPPPGTFSVHSGSFSLTSRLADAYSVRTLVQSHCSSSATIIALVVKMPVPRSTFWIRIVTVSSGPIVSHALISGTTGSRYHGSALVARSVEMSAASACRGGIQKPSIMPPPTTAVVVRNWRRSTSRLPAGASSFDGLSVLLLMMSVLRDSGAHPRGAMNRLANPVIRPAPARVRHLPVDVLVRRVRRLVQQRRRRQNLPRLAVAALRHVELLPRQLHRMRPVGRQPLDRRDGRTDRAVDRQRARAHRQAVDHHRAGAALADAAPVLGARQADRVAQDPQERGVRLDAHCVLNVVDEKRERHEFSS